MKHILITTIAAVLLVGCGTTKQATPPAEAKSVAEEPQPEASAVKLPEISINDAIDEGNIEAVKQHLAAGADLNARIHFSPKGLDLRTVKYEWLPESRMPPRPDASELGGITINVVGWRF